jgi:hypothetical protein
MLSLCCCCGNYLLSLVTYIILALLLFLLLFPRVYQHSSFASHGFRKPLCRSPTASQSPSALPYSLETSQLYKIDTFAGPCRKVNGPDTNHGRQGLIRINANGLIKGQAGRDGGTERGRRTSTAATCKNINLPVPFVLFCDMQDKVLLCLVWGSKYLF